MSKALFIRNLLLYFRHRKTVMMSLFSVFMMLDDDYASLGLEEETKAPVR